jgi:hypothetical protein
MEQINEMIRKQHHRDTLYTSEDLNRMLRDGPRLMQKQQTGAFLFEWRRERHAASKQSNTRVVALIPLSRLDLFCELVNKADWLKCYHFRCEHVPPEKVVRTKWRLGDGEPEFEDASNHQTIEDPNAALFLYEVDRDANGVFKPVTCVPSSDIKKFIGPDGTLLGTEW